MAARTATKSGRYLYAIVTAPGERTYDFAGIDGAPVYCIANGQVAAVVSDVLDDRIRPERRHLAAQQAVLKGLLPRSDAMLPMAFGIIADGPKAIQKILSRNHEAFLKQLQRVSGMVEMGLRVSLDVPNIFEYVVNTHPELRTARDRFLGSNRNPSQDDKIELGRLFDHLLNEDREAFTEKVEEILSRNHEAFLKQLQRVSGMVEMGLRVSLDVPNIFEYVVNTHPELRSARDRFLGPYRNPSQEDKIELGRLFDQLLNEDREAFTDKVEEILSGYCREIKRNKCRNESQVMSLACLVPRDGQDRFEAGVFEAAKLFDNNFTFDYNGPWAPHNFVELNLEL
jgi:hypothetical protein